MMLRKIRHYLRRFISASFPDRVNVRRIVLAKQIKLILLSTHKGRDFFGTMHRLDDVDFAFRCQAVSSSQYGMHLRPSLEIVRFVNDENNWTLRRILKPSFQLNGFGEASEIIGDSFLVVLV